VLAAGLLATGVELKSGHCQSRNSAGDSERMKLNIKDSHLSQTQHVHDPWLDILWDVQLVWKEVCVNRPKLFVVVMECTQSALLVYLQEQKQSYLSTAMS
jgi:hypothetical protein